jgi:xylan 1,4-beta-xylosidase
MNPEGIRKPAWFAYKYLHALQGNTLVTSDPDAMVSTQEGNLTAVLWDFEQPQQQLSNRPFYTRPVPSHPAPSIHFQVTHLAPRVLYHLQIHRTGYHANDAYTAYLEMGSPKDLTPAQIDHLNALTRDTPETDRNVRSSPQGTLSVEIPMSSNDIVLMRLSR